MFDAIVIGSGISGGWAAKELTERGLKTLLIERGPHVDARDYTDDLSPWELSNANQVPEDERRNDYPIQSTVYAFCAATKKFWVKDSEHPYSTPPGKPFNWIRGYQLGGRSIMWGRASFRLSDYDFSANLKDGYGVDWPIRYGDLAPWYDHVEEFAGVSGSHEGLAQLPDGKFLPPMAMSDCEADFRDKVSAAFPERKVIVGRTANLSKALPQHAELGRAQCQMRSFCSRGCSLGAYFCSLSSTLPAARRTGNLVTATDTIAHSLIYDSKTGRVTGVQAMDAKTGIGRKYGARVIFLCASTIPTTMILLNSATDAWPSGLANSSGMVGRNFMDHVGGVSATAIYPGLDDRYYRGRKPTGIYIPQYRNIDTREPYHRGFAFQGVAWRSTWERGRFSNIGIGEAAKDILRKPGPWMLSLGARLEMLPNSENRVSRHSTRRDKWGMAIPHIVWQPGQNELQLMEAAKADAKEMMEAAGARIVSLVGSADTLEGSVHEMGTARMGRNPKDSVLNQYNQAHDVPNLFITDGSAMTSTGTQNPSLTYMALSARAAHYAVEFLRSGKL